jgi:hypothetical protein
VTKALSFATRLGMTETHWDMAANASRILPINVRIRPFSLGGQRVIGSLTYALLSKAPVSASAMLTAPL